MRNLPVEVQSDTPIKVEAQIDTKQILLPRGINHDNGDTIFLGAGRMPATSSPSSLPCDGAEADQKITEEGNRFHTGAKLETFKHVSLAFCGAC
ncbi:hypothetical protein JRQ81_012187 [Phrynocephalus forsythii]|uniref:Uncharacterized protein n=1 Tax=Phrynocephalus forsythii TaxID=171643 RepID=A0A9Q0X5Y8_9SAUR|nr:hypothetical protein JRQ81_012187 [Phrynocephalus forsythii]